MACGTQSCGTSNFSARVFVKASCDGSDLTGFPGSPGEYGGLGSSLQVVDETPSDLFSSVLLSGEGRSGEFDSVIRVIRVLVLEWASLSRLMEGKRFVLRPPEFTVTTDASIVGWGAVCITHRLSGRWSVQESRDHINLLELKLSKVSNIWWWADQF